MPNTEQIATRLLKMAQYGVADTDSNHKHFEEDIRSGLRSDTTTLWIEEHEIPEIAPTLAHQEKSGVVQYLEDVVMSTRLGSPNTFYSPLLVNCIPHNFTRNYSYRITLKQSDDTPIVYGDNDWLVDSVAGVIRFYGDTPPVNPPKVSFYRYVGKVGLASFTSSAVVNIDLYVAPTDYATNAGDDDNGDGSDSAPFATLDRVYEEMIGYGNGSTVRIHILSGTYTLDSGLTAVIGTKTMNITFIGNSETVSFGLVSKTDRTIVTSQSYTVNEHVGKFIADADGGYLLITGNTETDIYVDRITESSVVTNIITPTTTLTISEDLTPAIYGSSLSLEMLVVEGSGNTLSNFNNMKLTACVVEDLASSNTSTLTLSATEVDIMSSYFNVSRTVVDGFSVLSVQHTNKLIFGSYVVVAYQTNCTAESIGLDISDTNQVELRDSTFKNVFTGMKAYRCFYVRKNNGIESNVSFINNQVGIGIGTGVQFTISPKMTVDFVNTNYAYYPLDNLFDTKLMIGTVTTPWGSEFVMPTTDLVWSTRTEGEFTIDSLPHIRETVADYNTYKMIDTEHGLCILIDQTFPECSSITSFDLAAGASKTLTIGRRVYNSLIKVCFELETETTGTMSFGDIGFSSKAIVIGEEPIINEYGGFIDDSIETFSASYNTSTDAITLTITNNLTEAFTFSYTTERRMKTPE